MRDNNPFDREERFYNTLLMIFFICGCSILAGLCNQFGCWVEESIKQKFQAKCSFICTKENTDCIVKCLKIFYKKR